MGARALAIGSWEEGALAVHANGGMGFGGASREYFWSAAATIAAAQRLTVVGEVMGRRLSELSLVQDVYQPHPLMPGVDTMRWLPVERGVHSTFFVTGAKLERGQQLAGQCEPAHPSHRCRTARPRHAGYFLRLLIQLIRP